ncbi:MAG: FG-GAP repeat protein [Ardenticatenaceae bacterium]|nr:FG-GAP repeat protein [Ardenticatenaceae bacterium]MCB9443255.1 FG-GAP repeat protein [Ardenticatenaceae bacterium]
MRKITTILIIFAFVILGVWFLQNSFTQAAQAAPSTPPSAMSTNSSPNDLASVEWESIQAQILADTSANPLWVQQIKLTASDGAAFDYFYTVAVSEDTVVVGAYGDDDNGADSGAAYVYSRNGTIWIQQAKLTASDGAADDWFGRAVAVSGDTVVVGAVGDDDNGSSSGSAYIFVKPVGGWNDMTETAKITAADGATGDNFGLSVAVSSDTVVVGAYLDDDNGVDSGSAYVFIKPVGGWSTMTQTAKLTSADGAAGDEFGRDSIAISGDTVVVGAIGDDDNGSESGSAYVFVKPLSGWSNMTQTAKLTADDGAPEDFLGRAVSVSDDTVVVGAYGDDDNGAGSGSAYVFVKPVGGWSNMAQTAKLTADDGAAGDEFGRYAVGINGNTVVVGSYRDDDNGSDSGSAYVFIKPVSGWSNMTQTVKLTAADGAASDSFGTSVAISGDTIVVGSFGDSDNGPLSGSAYIFSANPEYKVYLPTVIKP